MAVSELIYDNWGNTTLATMLYDEIPVKYTITTSAGEVEIDEPVGWAKVPFTHKRSDRHGFIYESTGPDFKLEFPCDSGREEILTEYSLHGNDGECIFTKTLLYGDGIVEFQGILNLGKMEREEYAVSCMCERKSLQQKLGAVLSTKVDLYSDKDFDGNSVPTYVSDTILLQGQTLSEKFKADSKTLKTSSYTDTRANIQAANLFFTVQDPIYNTLQQTYYPSTLGVSGDPMSHANDTHNLFEMKSHGIYHFKVSIDFQLDIRIHPQLLSSGKKVTNAYINVYLRVQRADNVTVDNHLLYAMTPFNPGLQGFHYPRVTFIEEIDLDLDEDDKVILYALVFFEHNANRLKSVDFVCYETQTVVEITGTSDAAPSLVEGYLIKRAMDYALRRILGLGDVLKSAFYSKADGEYPSDGCGAYRLLTNGGRIRSTTKYPMIFTWSDLLVSMDAIDAIGVGYEWDSVDQKEILRIEEATHFYRDVEVIELDPEFCFDYKESTASDLIFNKYVLGYEKYKEEEEYSADEIHAYHEYKSPIKTESNDFERKSKFIASGYLIETTRRTQFDDDPTASTTYDDDIFIFHVKSIDFGDFAYAAVTDEPFDDVSGTLFPETKFNMTLSPKRMLMAHSPWLMSSLIYKDASEEIISTLVKQNRDFSTTLKADYCERGDTAHLPLKASDNVILAVFNDFAGIYSPERVDLKARLQMHQVRMIMNAHRGLDPDGKNYGYITFTDDMGIKRKGWLQELSFDRETEAVTFKLLKKKFPL